VQLAAQVGGSSSAIKPSASPSEIISELERDPRNPKLLVRLGRIYFEQNNFPLALETFQHAVEVGPASPEAHNWLGVAFMQRGDFPSAVSEFRKAVSLDPKYGRAYTNLGSALSKSGQLPEGVKAFEKALALEPNSRAAHLNLGIALRDSGDAKGALVQFGRVARSEPNNAALQKEIGQALEQSGDLAGAVSAYERSLELNPALEETYYELGLALKQQSAAAHKNSPPASAGSESSRRAQELLAKGDLNSAKEQLIEALSKDQDDADAHNLLGYILGQQGDLPSALEQLQRAVVLRPDSADAHYNLGAALWYSGSRPRAITELETSVRLDPASGPGYALLALAERESGNLELARKNMERALALLPPAAANYIDLGIIFLRQGELDKALGQLEAGVNSPDVVPTPDWDGAIAGLRQLSAKYPERADAPNMLGLLLGRKGADSSEVLAEFREAYRLRPDYAEAHNNAGLVLAQTDETDKAIAEFREAIRIRPDYGEAHGNLGAALMIMDVEGAIPELEKAVTLDPSSVQAQFNLAEAYGNSPSHGLAKQIGQLQKVVALAPTFARAHLALGKALLQDGKRDEAIAQLQEATRLAPESGESHYQLGLALARAGKQADASAELQKGRQLSAADDRNQNANLDISEGHAAFQKGEFEQAAAKFQHAIKLEPESSIAYRDLAMVLEQQGDRAGAATAYKKAVDLNPGDLASRQSLKRLTLSDAPSAATSRTTASEADDPQRISAVEGYIREGRFQEVEPLLTAYLTEHPNSSWGWYALGYSQFAQKKIGASIQALAKSLTLDITNAEAHKILGRDLMVIGRFDAAQTEFEQAIRYDAKSAESHYDLGNLFSLRETWEEACKQFEAAIQIRPSYVEAIDALGFAEEGLGNDAAAVQTYERAVALNEQQHGSFVAAHVNLSAYYNRSGDPARALQYAEQALELNPKADTAWFQKARAQEREGHIDDAVASLNHAILLNGRSSSYYYVLAGLYRRLGKTEESQKALEAFTRLDHENNDIEKMRRNLSKPAGGRNPGENE
jgi:tetratricopeptide (TPR) repeat protein